MRLYLEVPAQFHRIDLPRNKTYGIDIVESIPNPFLLFLSPQLLALLGRRNLLYGKGNKHFAHGMLANHL
ncbi:MAG: hypothetical protein DDT31_01289 [Syntrophomonadaceae bacterium]|nr:hypothetical protein [Bacillota bacterium]